MASRFSELKILLIQARDEADILKQERDCFLERCQIQENQLFSVNLIEKEPDQLQEIDLANFDALMIGGSGAYSAASDYPWMPWLRELIQEAHSLSFPTFGSCWGHQVIARALGGTVIYDKELTEMGCHHIELNEEGQKDILFKDFPSSFMANMGHHDRVSVLPPDAVDLAFSKTQPHQAFRIKEKPIYGTQFHSELNAEREKERLLAYRAFYPEVETEELFQEIIGNLAETTEVDELLHDFLKIHVAKNN